jgi:uncharacterized membrane protein YdjX (TVP38/TMEM64 family)
MKHKRRHYGYIILILLVGLFIALPYFLPGLKKFSSPEYVREYLLGFGWWGRIMYILLILAAIPLPIPSTPLIVVGGYLYGQIWGTLLSLSAVVLGSLLSFSLVRYFGKPLLEKMVDAHHIAIFNHLFKKRGKLFAFISYIIPIFPSDVIGPILGLTRMSYSLFLPIVVGGHIPRILLITSFGNDLQSGFTWKTLILLILCLVFVLIAIFREPLKKFMFKELREIETEAKVVEKEVENIIKIKKKGN